jgi:hypothetical protein
MLVKQLLICNVDREDLWVTNGFTFDIPNNINTYAEATAYLKKQLEDIEPLVHKECNIDELIENNFDPDDILKVSFKELILGNSVTYIYKLTMRDESEESFEYRFSLEFVSRWVS